jgi:hypothetical protein
MLAATITWDWGTVLMIFVGAFAALELSKHVP